MEITLDQLLASREQRSARQQELLNDNPDATLVCLTVIMPGSVKRNFFSLITAGAALQSMIERYNDTILHLSTRDLVTGYEAYLVTTLDHAKAKEIASNIEDTHPLGRLFDIDVILPDGVPMSRHQVGCSPRRCLLCDNDARFCMRNRTHSSEELHNKIKDMVNAYVQ